MADNKTKTMIKNCVIILILCSVTVNSIIVMNQKHPCDDLDGTWRTVLPENNENAYFNVKSDGEHLRITTAVNIEKLPFRSFVSVKQGDSYLLLREHFYVTLSTNTDNSEQETCELHLRDGTILTKVSTINHVHLIFMNHLDVGYNTNRHYRGSKELIPGYIVNVLNFYFQVYFPRAARLGNELRALTSNESFIYTTHPWLVNLYLDCPQITLSGVKLQCPSQEQIETFRRAVWMGDIAWHAGPFNTEPESANHDLFSYSLTLSKDLDDYFGLKKEGRTASNRDVPGWTQAAIPHLVEHNIEALSIGVNPSSAPPDVPSPNVWTFRNSSVITYWHKGGYPLQPGPSPSQPGGLSRKDCQFVKGLDHVLCFAFRQDNDGPPESVDEIKNYYKILHYQFPGAKISAATFEDFTKLIIPIKHTLPVVSKEIGDTWIQGPASDPIKMSHYRTISRMRSKCLKENRCNPNDKRIKDMSRMLIKLPEHTYGLAMNFDWRNWSNTDFQPLQYREEGFINDTKCWLSHREFNDLSIQALKDHPLAKEIKDELRKLRPYVPDLSKYTYHDSSKPIKCKNGMILKVGPDGDLIQMTDIKGRDWADENHTLAKIMYRTYNSSDFDDFARQYNYLDGVGIWKPGLDNYTQAQSRYWASPKRGVMVSRSDDPCAEIYVRVITLDAEVWWKYGGPSEYMLKYSVPDNSSVDIEYQFYNKPSTRMPESLLLHFQPKPRSAHNWYLHKVGYLVQANNVVNNGSQYVHAVDEGVAYYDSNHNGLFIESMDVATVLVRTDEHEPSPFPVPLTPMRSSPTAMAYNIYNNIWETNFIFWYPYQPQDKHYKARFRLKFK